MEIARLYRTAQQSLLDLVADLDEQQWTTPVPCNPGWTVRDVLSHLAGVTDDILHQRLEGVTTDPWTAAQVERWRDTPTEALIARWNEQIGPVAEALEGFGERLPVFDCHSHEHDVRHALGRPGNRGSEIIGIMASGFARQGIGRPLRILCDTETFELAGDGEPIELTGMTPFEVVRSRLGRRSRAQVAGYAWSQPLTDDELDRWFRFGPSAVDIVE
jgi:uncharacterized protein (TIGR03083 family)